jgi:hypothetical protein
MKSTLLIMALLVSSIAMPKKEPKTGEGIIRIDV